VLTLPDSGRVEAHRQALLAALGPTARVAHLGPAALTTALAAIPLVVTVAKGSEAVATPLILMFVVGGAALGWAAEDPAAELLASMPVSSPQRLSLRLLCVAAVAASALAFGLAVVAVGRGLPRDVADRGPEALAAAAVALAVGLVAARRGVLGAGPIGVTAGVLGTGLVAALAHRWPSALPTFTAGPAHVRWWALVAGGLAVAVHAGRDLGRR
jgi:hypothetical protein